MNRAPEYEPGKLDDYNYRLARCFRTWSHTDDCLKLRDEYVMKARGLISGLPLTKEAAWQEFQTRNLHNACHLTHQIRATKAHLLNLAQTIAP